MATTVTVSVKNASAQPSTNGGATTNFTGLQTLHLESGELWTVNGRATGGLVILRYSGTDFTTLTEYVVSGSTGQKMSDYSMYMYGSYLHIIWRHDRDGNSVFKDLYYARFDRVNKTFEVTGELIYPDADGYSNQNARPTILGRENSFNSTTDTVSVITPSGYRSMGTDHATTNILRHYQFGSSSDPWVDQGEIGVDNSLVTSYKFLNSKAGGNTLFFYLSASDQSTGNDGTLDYTARPSPTLNTTNANGVSLTDLDKLYYISKGSGAGGVYDPITDRLFLVTGTTNNAQTVLLVFSRSSTELTQVGSTIVLPIPEHAYDMVVADGVIYGMHPEFGNAGSVPWFSISVADALAGSTTSLESGYAAIQAQSDQFGQFPVRGVHATVSGSDAVFYLFTYYSIATVTLSAPAGVVTVAATPTSKDVTVTAYNPSITIAGLTEATPTVKGLTLTKYDPFVNIVKEKKAVTTAVNLAITPYRPIVNLESAVVAQPTVKSISLTEYNPTVLTENVTWRAYTTVKSIGVTAHQPTVEVKSIYDGFYQGSGVLPPLGLTNLLITDVSKVNKPEDAYSTTDIIGTSWGVTGASTLGPDGVLDITKAYDLGDRFIDIIQSWDLFSVPPKALEVTSRWATYKTVVPGGEIDVKRSFKCQVTAVANTIDITNNYQTYGKTFYDIFLGLVNDLRAELGLAVMISPVSSEDNVAYKNAMQFHTNQIGHLQQLDHQSPVFPEEVRTPLKRAKLLYDADTTGAGEVILSTAVPTLDNSVDWVESAPYLTATARFNGWYNSPPHYAIMTADWVVGSNPKLLYGVSCFTKDTLSSDLLGGTFGTTGIPSTRVVSGALFVDTSGVSTVEYTLDIKQKYELGAFAVIDISKAYITDRFINVRNDHVSSYAIKVAADHISPTRGVVFTKHIAPIWWQVKTAHVSIQDSGLEVRAQHKSRYNIDEYIRVAADHISIHSNKVLATHVSAYNDSSLISVRHISPYSNAAVIRTHHVAAYRDLKPVSTYHVSGFGDAAVIRANHASAYGDLAALRASHLSSYSDSAVVRTSHLSSYDNAHKVRQDHVAAYLSKDKVKLSHVSYYSDANKVRVDHVTPLWDLFSVKASHAASYSLNHQVLQTHQAPIVFTTTTKAEHTGVNSLLTYNPVRADNIAIYNMADRSSEVYKFETYAMYKGIKREIVDVSLRTSEDDTMYVGGFTVLRIEDYVGYVRDEPITIRLAGEDYELIIDNKDIRRGSQVGVDLNVTVIGSLAKMKAPRVGPLTKTYDTATTAEDIVTDLLPGYTITWNMVNWPLPAFRVAFSDTEPLAAAKTLVQAGGGVIETLPDGTVNVRKRYDVALNSMKGNYSMTLSDYVDNLSSSEAPEYNEGFDRIRITEQQTSFSDVIEYDPDTEDGVDLRSGTLRVYPSPLRDSINVTTTSLNPVALNFIGTSTREVEVELEFTEGEANLSYPIQSVVSVEWYSAPLSGLAYETYGRSLTTDKTVNEGYGVALVKYLAVSTDYSVLLQTTEPIQFLVEDIT
jgi:hypothetical protein